MNCRSRALPEVSVLCPLFPIRHPPPFISSSRLGAALWCVFNVQTSFWLCSKGAGELRMSTFPAIPESVKPAHFRPLSALLLVCSHCLMIVALGDCSHLGKAAEPQQSPSSLQAACAALNCQGWLCHSLGSTKPESPDGRAFGGVQVSG